MFVRTTAAVAGIALVTVSAGLGAKAPRPVVRSFSARTRAVPGSGGHATLAGVASHAATCTITASPSLSGFPRRVRCAGRFATRAHVPGGGADVFRFTVVAHGAGGSSRPRTATVRRKAAAPGTSSGAPVPGSPGSTAGGTSTSGAVYGSGGASTSNLPACSSGNNAFLDASPLSAENLSYIDPLGHMSGTHVLPDQADHIYFYMRDPTQPNPVYAPGKVTLFGVVAVKHFDPANPSNAHYDYELDFSPCRDVLFWFQHISQLSDRIAGALATVSSPQCQTFTQGTEGTTNCYYPQLDLALASGEQVGDAGGPETNTLAFDFGAVDSRTAAHVFVDNEIEAGTMGQSFFHSACALDYYSGSLQSALRAQLRNAHPGVNGIPACGATMQDEAGTLQGNWYRQGAYTPGTQGPFDFLDALAIVHNPNDPTLGEVSAGGTLAGNDSGTQITFPAESSGVLDREPSQITPGATVYCFQDSNGLDVHFDVQLVDATTLKIDRGSGACSASPTLTDPLTYVR